MEDTSPAKNGSIGPFDNTDSSSSFDERLGQTIPLREAYKFNQRDVLDQPNLGQFQLTNMHAKKLKNTKWWSVLSDDQTDSNLTYKVGMTTETPLKYYVKNS